jgi:hypothetical protein
MAHAAGRARVTVGDLAEAMSSTASPSADPPAMRVRLDRTGRALIRRAVAIAVWEGRERAGVADVRAALAERGTSTPRARPLSAGPSDP